jgi:pre-mRNA-splicing factor CWC26
LFKLDSEYFLQFAGRRMEMLEQMERQEKGIKQDQENYEWGRGDVQKEEEEERKKRLEDEKTAPFSRHADDSQMNSWMKEVSRWGDPMAAMSKVPF